jgi:hypothetical protein
VTSGEWQVMSDEWRAVSAIHAAFPMQNAHFLPFRNFALSLPAEQSGQAG